MKIYLVGGAVRDKLLNLPIKEKDYVVVGATEQEMQQQGYRKVGKEFPVFLHPKTGEEYALARMERKVLPGYTGFTFDTTPTVTLEEDLKRRDLTINSMAETLAGALIDPYHGKADLDQKILRHTSEAFIEDPVRILRVARFLARYAHLGFHIAKETYALMKKMVELGEVNALVAERVWKELERALSEKSPEKFFEALADCGAHAILFPQINLRGAGMNALSAAVKLSPETSVRFAALLHDIPNAKESIPAIANRYRIPNEYRQLALLSASHAITALNAKKLSAIELLQLYTSLDIFRRQKRFENFLLTCQAIAISQNIDFDLAWLVAGAQVLQTIDIPSLTKLGFEGKALVDQIKDVRIKKLTEWLASS